MTNPDHTHITLLCDRSGSMSVIRGDAEGAVNAFVKDQASQPGTCTLLLVDFDDVDRHRVVHDGAIGDTPTYELTPRGNTPLLDALGETIVHTGERLAAMPEDQRPAQVYFVYQTDGQENASRDWTKSRVREVIERQERDYSWVFVALGVGAEAAAEAATIGVRYSTYAVADSGPAVEGAYLSTSNDVANHRQANAASMRAGGQSVAYSHTAAEVDSDGNVIPTDDDED